MLRMIVILIVLVAVLMLIGMLYMAYRKVKRGIGGAWDKGVETLSEQQQRWKRREQLKSLPEFIQQAHQQSETIEQDTELLPAGWQASLRPLNSAMQTILNISVNDLPKAEKIRTFYNTSLPAYAGFVAKLRTDHLHLDDEEKQKAVDNLAVFEADFAQYEQRIQAARRFDFDVLMDVIKVRLKNR